jgi:hypothetical protein
MGKDRAIQNVANAAKNVASGQKCSKRIEKKITFRRATPSQFGGEEATCATPNCAFGLQGVIQI